MQSVRETRAPDPTGRTLDILLWGMSEIGLRANRRENLGVRYNRHVFEVNADAAFEEARWFLPVYP